MGSAPARRRRVTPLLVPFLNMVAQGDVQLVLNLRGFYPVPLGEPKQWTVCGLMVQNGLIA